MRPARQRLSALRPAAQALKRTKADDAFIDEDDDDAELLDAYGYNQDFDDEADDGFEDDGQPKKKRGRRREESEHHSGYNILDDPEARPRTRTRDTHARRARTTRTRTRTHDAHARRARTRTHTHRLLCGPAWRVCLSPA